MCVNIFSLCFSHLDFWQLDSQMILFREIFLFFFRGNQTESVGFSSEMTCLRVTLPL